MLPALPSAYRPAKITHGYEYKTVGALWPHSFQWNARQGQQFQKAMAPKIHLQARDDAGDFSRVTIAFSRKLGL